MGRKKKYNDNQLRDYSSLFTRSSVQQWLKGNFASIENIAQQHDSTLFAKTIGSYLDYLKYVYKILEANYQNEYILKNSFLNEWLINQLGNSNNKVFSEYRVGNSIADLAMFNGVSRVFEIKTELDSKQRLDSQIDNYKLAFNEIYLIVPRSKLQLYSNNNFDIGIVAYDLAAESKFQVMRKAKTQAVVDPNTIMNILHTKEYKKVVQRYYGSLPEMTSFTQFQICADLLKAIPNETLNKLFIEQMKSRVHRAALSSRHKEFNQISLALKLNTDKRHLMINALKTPVT
ncbi:sce7726 family protein [Owenweeksia hongkongensis]|uniref:sce7726 family protein n=1 Tax=Owenweeksia hongkongensis TaxID=253245 RepID=UPI003A8E32C1